MSNTKVERKWHVLDASEESFGRMSSKIAMILRGKNKVTFTPHLDEGDNVIVINSDKLKFTGNKALGKIYHHHSGYLGGMKDTTLEDKIRKDSREVIREAVFGMLPKNKLRSEMMKRLRVFKSGEHPYADKLGK